MFSSTNEVMGTAYRSRIDNIKYQFAGKTGTAQVKKITEKVVQNFISYLILVKKILGTINL